MGTPPRDEDRKRVMRANFDRELLRDATSTVFREYCRRVHGVARFQYNGLTERHFEELLSGLELLPGASFLDVGCAVGTMTVAVARRTGARGTGLDFAPAAIALAKRTVPPEVDVRFIEGDLDELCLEPSSLDAVMAIDSLYFAHDLDRTIDALIASLQPGGRLVAFYSTFLKPGESADVLSPGRTPLAKALRARGTDFRCSDLTADDREHWRRAVEVTEALRPEWEAAGEHEAWEARHVENSEIAPLVADGRSARYLYVARRA